MASNNDNEPNEDLAAGSGLSAWLGDDWWRDPDNEIIDLENTDRAIKTLYARLVDDSWEYAIVWWHYHQPNLQMIIKDGKCFHE